MAINFKGRAELPGDVLVSELDGESVILNLKTDSHFGLDEVGAWMWGVVTSSDSIESAYKTLRNQWDVEPALLRSDLASLLEKLVDVGLVRINS